MRVGNPVKQLWGGRGAWLRGALFLPLWASMTAYCPPPLSKSTHPTSVIHMGTRAHMMELSGLQRARALSTEAQEENSVQGVPSTEQALVGAGSWKLSYHVCTALHSRCMSAKGHDNQCPEGPTGTKGI